MNFSENNRDEFPYEKSIYEGKNQEDRETKPRTRKNPESEAEELPEASTSTTLSR